jgi:hypothetical protein
MPLILEFHSASLVSAHDDSADISSILLLARQFQGRVKKSISSSQVARHFCYRGAIRSLSIPPQIPHFPENIFDFGAFVILIYFHFC